MKPNLSIRALPTIILVAGLAPLAAQAQSQQCDWSPVGGGTSEGFDPSVQTMEVFDDGSGPALFVGGNFQQAGGIFTAGVAKWNGSAWSGVGGGLWFAGASDLEGFDDGTGPALYATGDFFEAGGQPAERIARWTPATGWEHVGGGFNPADGPGVVLEAFDDGSGPALYVGGLMTEAGGVPVSGIARWDGQAWSDVGGGVDGFVSAMTVYDDGTGPTLYAAGRFSLAGGTPARNIARWDGDQWTPLGPGLLARDGRPIMQSLVVYDDGSGPALYAGGKFDTIGGGAALDLLNIARWDGAEWSPVGGGLSTWTSTSAAVQDMIVFDDGAGPALFVAGLLNGAGGQPANNLVKWDGHDWSPVGAGLPLAAASLGVYDEGEGPSLFAGGNFTEIDGQEIMYIARLDGCEQACRADLSGDGVLDFFDFLLFGNLFDMGDPRADFDGDGQLTIFDFLFFQNEFVLGCS